MPPEPEEATRAPHLHIDEPTKSLRCELRIWSGSSDELVCCTSFKAEPEVFLRGEARVLREDVALEDCERVKGVSYGDCRSLQRK